MRCGQPQRIGHIPPAIIAPGIVGFCSSVAGNKGKCRRELNSLVQAAFQEAEAVMVKGLRLEETEALRLLLYRVIENLEEDRTTC